jgi:glucan 1,3-beta-glucosidase
LSGQQWVLKGITINGANTGIKAGAFNIVCLECSFQNGAVGIDASGVSGSLTMIDSTGNYLGTLVTSTNSGGSAQNSIILDNVQNSNSGGTVTLNGNTVLQGNVVNTWVHGDLVSCNTLSGVLGTPNRYSLPLRC